jgi:membrane associated rhomboid family serine protease
LNFLRAGAFLAANKFSPVLRGVGMEAALDAALGSYWFAWKLFQTHPG